ncbi:MAG: HAD-IIIA family hydrolase [Nitrospirales bacterium]|nr:HAD-IIIA family hydrolase [Nitrospirales bacterium]
MAAFYRKDCELFNIPVMSSTSKPLTVFFDRDGTLNQDVGYLDSAEDLIVFPGVPEALARLNEAGGVVVLVTNQSGVARGLILEDNLARIHEALQQSIQAAGGCIAGWYICPHHPNEGCACRKPKNRLVKQAVAELNLDLTHSYVVGDKDSDMQLAYNIGAVGVLVTTSSHSDKALTYVSSGVLSRSYVASGVPEAVEWILADARRHMSEPCLNES